MQGAAQRTNATGDHCPEGWTFHEYPGPGFPELPDFSAESSCYTFVDQQNTSGLGANTPISTGNLYDGVHALVNGRFVTLRLPYPIGLFAKGFERTHRRSQCRLEGTRSLGAEWRPNAVDARNR